MFETSKDVLYLVISFCIIWVTVFICWMFYYLMKIFKDTSKIVEEFRIRLQGLSEAVKNIGEKVEKLYGLVGLVTGGVGNFMKKNVKKKADAVVEEQTDRFEEAAKEAVDKAVEATADKMRKFSKKIRKE